MQSPDHAELAKTAASLPSADIVPAVGYRPDIDGLRAVAVLAVVVYHAFPQVLGGGFVGVDVFFVISGYLISTIILGQVAAGHFSFRDFYGRRVRRIFPALIVVLVATLALGWFGLFPDQYAALGKHVAAGMGFVSNLLLWSESGYFDAEAHAKPLLHLWSLGIEEQFYIAWPLLAWAAWRLRLAALAFVGTVVVASFAFNVVELGRDPVAAFYSPLSRAWELGVGGLLACLVLAGRGPGKLLPGMPAAAQAHGLSLVGALLLAYGLVSIDGDRPFPGWWALLPVAGTALLVAAGKDAWFNRNVLSNRVAVWIGLVSYPLYLWHWPALFVASRLEQGEPSLALRSGAIAVSIVLSALTYVLVERRLRRRKGPVAPILVAVGMLVAATGAFVWQGQGLPQRPSVVRSELTPAAAAQFTGPLWQYTTNDLCLQQYPYAASGDAAWWFCMKSRDRPVTLVILGNSYANQLYPGFVANPALAHHTVLSIGTCEIGDPPEVTTRKPNNPCSGARPGRERAFLQAVVEREPSIRFAVLAGLPPKPDDAYLTRIREWLDFLEARGIQVVVFSPHHRIRFDPRECFRSADEARDCTFPMGERAAQRAQFRAAYADRLSATNPGTRFFDQNAMFCQGVAGCDYVHDGMPLNRDASGHLSEYASILLHDEFTPWARQHMPEILDPAYIESGIDAGAAP